MDAENDSILLQRRLISVSSSGITLLDAVEQISPNGGRQVSLFFGNGTDPTRISPGPDWTPTESGTIAGAPWLVFETGTDQPFEVAFAGETVRITPARPELDVLEGRNAAVAVRNGESAATVLAWLDYHCMLHGMTAAVILNRAKPGTDKSFVEALRQGLAEASFSCRVVLLDSDIPLGRPDLPAEAHPYCAPEAPGKDRMKIPPAAPWASPLSALLYYEIARHRFLADARAVANFDVFDLLAPDKDGNIFDRAVAAKGGLISLVGRHCYPWRVRNGEPIRFADHVCVQFDSTGGRQRWCIAPAKTAEKAVWRLLRIGNALPDETATGHFYRFMALRHPTRSVSKIVPKTSLIEHPPLLAMAHEVFGHNPVRMPQIEAEAVSAGPGRRVIVTTMKNEGPFILEWIAYHRTIGFDDFLIYTNDCTDGTDSLLDLLQSRGIVQHRENPFHGTDLKPQHAALQAAETEPLVKTAKWVTCIDVDEYINIKTGAGRLDDLFAALPDANMISMTWRLFGNSDIHEYRDGFIIDQFARCAPEFARKPHQAWGFKTLFQNLGIFRKLGVHRPKGLNAQLLDQINWVNGSGVPLPKEHYRNAWRSTAETYGYDLVTLNHYAVRSAESFLVKRDRGRVNHVDRDQGLAYWFRMNNNAEQDHSIQRMLPALKAEYDKLLADTEIAGRQAHCVRMHRAKIEELRATPNYADFYADLTGSRLERLSRLHGHFGANVFLAGPSVIPDEVVSREPGEDFFFTVEKGETAH